MNRGPKMWLALGWIGFALLPWHLVAGEWFDFLPGFTAEGPRSAAGLVSRPDARGGSRRSSSRCSWPPGLLIARSPQGAGRALADCRGSARTCAHRRTRLRDRNSGLELGVPRRAVRRARTDPGRHGTWRGADGGGIPDAAVLWPCRARLVPRRCLRGLCDRQCRRADDRLRVFPGRHHPDRAPSRTIPARWRSASLRRNSSTARSGGSIASPRTCAAASPGTRCFSPSWSASGRRRSVLLSRCSRRAPRCASRARCAF